jgi:sulfur carrier protein
VSDITVHVNGRPVSFPDGTGLAEVVASATAAPRGVAVAVAGEVVPRSQWPVRPVHDGDRVEILTAVQGG